MSSGAISEAERKELQAAERGELLINPSDWSSDESLGAAPVSRADESSIIDDEDDFYGTMSYEEQHIRVHQAAVAYLYRKATGQRTTKPLVAEEFKVTFSDLRWRLKVYRGYYERLQARQDARELARLDSLRARLRSMPLFILNNAHELVQADYQTAISWWNAGQNFPHEAPRLKDHVDGTTITTSALPWFEHNAQNPTMPPIIWETSISMEGYERYIDEGEQWRYLTWSRAQEGHRKVVEYFRGEDDSEDSSSTEDMDKDETLVEAVARILGKIDDSDQINDFEYEELPETP
jgi:hypothetical protein